jgi:Protein kinase domain/zinc-ribbon domain
MRCPSCSTANPDTSRFCSSCGSPLDLDFGPTEMGTTPLSPSPPVQTPRLDPPAGTSRRRPSADRERFVPGTLLSQRYRIVALVGKGGMGEVYRADDLKLGQTVALKFLPVSLSANEDALKRFHAEVRLARQISHPNVCRVFDVGESDGRIFFTMEYVDGEDLATLLRRIGRLPADKGLEIARQLCAGLAAAHEYGVLHRDLKPANIMLDGRGKVRITDFGLAAFADDIAAEEIRSGTPAYMAPEQTAGLEVTVRSDLYSLGLVLFEVFTGKRATDTVTPGDLHRSPARSPSSPTSSREPALDPVVERVILRCLEKNPEKRPASALQVAAALPGGDPLAAALAAGETPSPEMVAAAGDEDAIRPRTAWLLLAGALLAISVVVALTPYTTLLGRAPIEKSPEVLEDRARDFLRRLGYTESPADSTQWFLLDLDYLQYGAQHSPSTRRFNELRTAEPAPMDFWYRSSPKPLVAIDSSGTITDSDPPYDVSGMTTLEMDAHGHLLQLLVVPPQVDDSKSSSAEPTWSACFAEAGLDITRFSPAGPKWLPPVPFDKLSDWEGNESQPSGSPLHVTAASYHGKPVYFQVIGPWSRPARMQESPQTLVRRIAAATFTILVLALLVGGFFLARRNTHLGRGDRKGALRVASVIFAAVCLNALMGWHAVAKLDAISSYIVAQFSFGLFFAAFAWLTYVALEPYLRRRSPQLLISWTRLLDGRFRDPLIGRDLLVGALFGSALAAVVYFRNALPGWINIPGRYPLDPGRLLLGTAAEAISQFAGPAAFAVIFALGFMSLLTLAQLVFRKRWLAIAVCGLVLFVVLLPGQNLFLEAPTIALEVLIILVAMARFGLLGFAFTMFFESTLTTFFQAFDFSHWYSARSWFALLVCLALALYGFRRALGGKPILSAIALEE